MNYLKSASTKLLLEKATAALWTATNSYRKKQPLHAGASMRLWDAAFEELERRWLESFPLPRLCVRQLSPLFAGTLAVSIEGPAAHPGAFEVFMDGGKVQPWDIVK